MGMVGRLTATGRLGGTRKLASRAGAWLPAGGSPGAAKSCAGLTLAPGAPAACAASPLVKRGMRA